MKQTNIVIIGSGIAGISAALYLKKAGVEFTILEGNLAGGMLNELKGVENFPAQEKTSGSDILISLMDQLRRNNIEITYGNVQTILKEKEGFEVVSDVDSYEAKAVIVATGMKIKSSNIIGEEKYAGMGVSYCATCDGNFFKGLGLAVIGNNNICLEEAFYLSNIAAKVYLICPDEELLGDKDLIAKIKNKNNINIMLSTLVDEIVGDDFGVNGIKVKNEVINVAGVFPYIGKKTGTQILNNLKPEMKGIFVVANEEGKTNIPGLFAAGDIVYKKVKQLITAAGDGASAATSAQSYVEIGI